MNDPQNQPLTLAAVPVPTFIPPDTGWVFPPSRPMTAKRPPLFVYWLNTGNNYRAVVIAEGSDDARLVALTHEPSGWWHTASATKIAECRASRTRQVLAMERL